MRLIDFPSTSLQNHHSPIFEKVIYMASSPAFGHIQTLNLKVSLFFLVGILFETLQNINAKKRLLLVRYQLRCNI